jgi:D-glycero-D-manno-heptose 1,7-bisphosphate phosphatase
MNSAVFLDRDGVINRKPPEGDYITRWEDMELLPGVVEGIGLLNQANFCVIVITNQRCVAKGLISEAGLEEIHRRMTEILARSGARVDGIYYCPHDLEASCACRKPAPGMLLEAARSRGIDLPSSWMVGDSDIDVEAGRRAGCKTVLLRETGDSIVGPKRTYGGQRQEANIVASSLPEAIRQILCCEGVGSN